MISAGVISGSWPAGNGVVLCANQAGLMNQD